MVAGQSIVRSFGYEQRCFEEFDKISDELYETGLKSVFYSSITNPGTRFVNAIVYAAVAVFEMCIRDRVWPSRLTWPNRSRS